MRRKFQPFDAERLRKEFSELPADDKKALSFAMRNYQSDLEVGYSLRHYGSGLMMIKGRGQGRCLSFVKNMTSTLRRASR